MRSGRDAGSTAALAAEPTAPHLYELRIYTAEPGKMDALHKRFRDHTLRLFEKHGIKSVGYVCNADSATWNAERPPQPARAGNLAAHRGG